MFQSFARSSARNAALVAAPSLLVSSLIASATTSQCEQQQQSQSTKDATWLRKRNTLKEATSPFQSLGKAPKRFNTRQELSKIRSKQDETMQRWDKDEEGWRELPARAWPAYQPTPEQMKGIAATIASTECSIATAKSSSRWSWRRDAGASDSDGTPSCQELLFQQATTLVFYNIDPEGGLKHFQALAKQGHVESMVACGVILVEGLGVPPQEEAGIEWFRKAVALNSAQACYELATVYYTGVHGVLEEEPVAAFELFRKAAEKDHTGALYMMADCLVEGEGTQRDVGKAVPLFFRAAERGHRYSRQRIRELLAEQEYQ